MGWAARANYRAILPDGKIDPSDPIGESLGFTSDLFDGYLWKKGPDIYVSFIASRHEGRGNVRGLLDRLESTGLTVKVPTPFARMRMICEKRGYKTISEPTDLGPCEVMVSK
jgi:hypothetical protein